MPPPFVGLPGSTPLLAGPFFSSTLVPLFAPFQPGLVSLRGGFCPVLAILLLSSFNVLDEHIVELVKCFLYFDNCCVNWIVTNSANSLKVNAVDGKDGYYDREDDVGKKRGLEEGHLIE